MNNLKMTFYDWISYLFPGGILCWFLFEISPRLIQDTSELFITKSSFIQGVIFIIMSYVLGHFLHAISNYTLDLLPSGGYPSKAYFSKQFHEDFSEDLIQKLLRLMGNESPADLIEYIKGHYWFCFTEVTSNNPESLASLFLAHNGFYRGLTVCIILIIVIFNLLFSMCLFDKIAANIILIVFAILSFNRSKRFKNYLIKTVYTDFIRIAGVENDQSS